MLIEYYAGNHIAQMGDEIFLELLEMAKQLLSDNLVTVFTGVFIVMCIIYSSSSKKDRRLPPGPGGLPFLGYYPFLTKDPVKVVNDLGKKYGGIFGFNMCSQYVVFLNDATIVTEVLSKALDRPHVFDNVPFKFGITGENGAKWQELKHMTIRALKDMGLFRHDWEQIAQESASNLAEQILKQAGKPVDIRELTAECFSSNIVEALFGYKPPKGGVILNVVTKSIDIILGELSTLRLINFSKWLQKIMEYLRIEKDIDLVRDLQDLQNTVSDMVDQEMIHSHVDAGNTFVSQMQHEIKQRSKFMEGTPDYIIKGSTVSLFTGASETSRNTLVWTLIAMAENPAVQLKVHEELDTAIGKDGSITWAERKKVPYIYATILEGMRWRTLVPHSSLRMASQDIDIGGYVIPKGTFISANIAGLHSDPKHWKEPHRFMPERFLLEDGKTIHIPCNFMPFTTGKRNCPGKQLAFMSLMQYFSIIMQKFRVTPKEGEKVPYDEILGLTYSACNAELRFIPRQ